MSANKIPKPIADGLAPFYVLAVSKDIEWEGEGLDEIGKDSESGKVMVRVDDKFYRPAEVNLLLGDSTKAQNELGWKTDTSLEKLCEMMVQDDLEKVTRGVSY